MNVKVIFNGAGISNANVAIWNHVCTRYNRLHVPLEGRVVYHEVKGERILHEGRAYLLVNSYSPNFEMIPNYQYRHLYIDFRTMPPFANNETIEIDLSEDEFSLYLLKAVQTIIQKNIQLYQKRKIYPEEQNDQGEQIRHILISLLAHLQLRYGLQVVDNPKIVTALRYIDEHYVETIRNEDIASALYIDKRSLIRLFGKYMNMTPLQYLTQYRVERALENLRNGMSVTETAYSCGYQSDVSLRLAFKRVLGCTPKEILKQ